MSRRRKPGRLVRLVWDFLTLTGLVVLLIILAMLDLISPNPKGRKP